MSQSVDQRVVEMRFDNQQFERGVQKTMGTLDRLKQSLKFDGTAKGLENIDQAAKKVSFDGMAASVASLQKRFSTFGIVGMRVIQNLTDSVMGFAKNTIGFATDSIINGGKRRAMNIENAHFQLQGLLKDEEKVQAVMDDAMQSVDGTAYAYDEAAKAASQFAASGMEAGEEMQASLRAITGVAAMTNSEYEDISRVFTTVAGNGRLMGDQLLQLSSRGLNAAATIKDYFNGVNDGSIEVNDSVSAAVRSVTDGLEVTEGDIRSFVSDGKISFQMFAAAMDNAFGEHAKKANETFTGAMSNVKAALGRIGAEFISPLIVQNGPLVLFFNALRERINDIKANIGPLAELFTGSVSSMANAATKYLQKLDFTKHFEAFYNVVDTLKNIFSGLLSIIKPIGQSFRDVFPSSGMDAVVNFTAKLKELSANFKLNEKDTANLRSTFKGLFAVLDIVHTVISTVSRAIFPMSEGIGGLGSSILSVTGQIGEWLVALDETIKKNGIFGEIIQKISSTAGSALQWLGEKVEGVVAAIQEFMQNNFSVVAESRLKPFQKICEIAKAAMVKLAEAFEKVSPILAKMGSMIVDTLNNVGKGFKEAIHGEGFDSLIDLLNGGLMVGIGTGIMNFIGHMQNSVIKAIGMFSNINLILSNVKTTLISYQASLKADVLMKIAKAIAILAASLFVLSLIDSNKLNASLKAISVLFGELAASMAIFDKTLSNTGQMKLISAGQTMVALSAAVLILASALKKIAGIDSDKLEGALLGITVLIGELVAASLSLSKWGGKIEVSAASMVLFAEAINILTKAVTNLAQLDTDQLTQGLIGVSILLAELAAFMIAAKFGKFNVTQSLGIIGLAAALLILEKAVTCFGTLDTSVMEKGLLGIASALTAIVVAVKFMPKNMVGIGLGLIEVSAALKIISGVIQETGDMKWEEIGKGMVVLASSMIILATALRFMKGTLGAAASMLVISTALAIFTPCLKALGAMSLSEIGKAILALAAAFTVLGVAGAMISPLIPAILGLAGALALIGVAVAACGVGLLAFATGLASLTVSGVAGVTALVASLEILIVGVLGVIANSAEAIANAVKAIVLAIVDVIIECAPAIVEGVLALIEEVLKSLATHAPAIVAYLLEFLIGVINAVAERLPDLIQAVVNLFDALFRGVIESLKKIDPAILGEGLSGVGLIAAVIFSLSTVAGMIPGAMAGVLGIGLVIAELALVLAAIGAFAQIPGLEWLISEGGDLLQKIGTAIGQLIGGIIGGVMSGVSAILPQIGLDLSQFMVNVTPFLMGVSVVTAETLAKAGFLAGIVLLFGAADLIGGITNFLTGGSSLPQMGTNLSQFMLNAMPFFAGVMLVDESVLNAAKNLAGMIMLFTVAELIQGVTSWLTGGSSLSSFGEELAAFGPGIANFAETVKDVKPEAVEGAAAAAKIMAEVADNLPGQDGLMQKIFGDKSLAEFGTELLAFGPAIAEFGTIVKDVKPEAVEGAAAAASIMSEMAENLPETGGLKTVIFGDKKLSEFGEELVLFGPQIKQFAKEVANVKPEAVIGAASVTAIMAKLADGIPESGGIISWFKGDNNISTFGKNLAEFGSKFKEFYGHISDINAAKLTDVITGFGNLIDLAKGAKDVNTSAISGFARNLKIMGENGIDSFIQAFTDADSKVREAASNMLKSFIQAFTDADSKVREAAGNMLVSFIQGVKSKQAALSNTFRVMVVVSLTEVRAKYSEFYSAGSYLVDGFAKGISENSYKAAAQARIMAKSAEEAAKNQLDEHSPSKVFGQIGKYVAEGFANGIHDNTDKAAKSAEELAQIGTEAAKEVAESLKNSNSIFSEFVEKTDENGNAVEITLEKAAEAFKSFRNSVKDSIKDATGVFDAFEVETDITGKQLLENLQSQITGISEWATNIQALAGRGLNEGLLKALSDMGPSGAKYANALVTMTDAELKKLNALYLKRIGLNGKTANQIAASFLEGGKKVNNTVNATLKKTAEAFTTLRDSIKDSIKDAMGVFDAFEVETDMTGKQLLKNLQSQITGITEWASNIQILADRGINKGLLKVLSDMGPSGAKYINTLVTMSDKELKKLNKLYKKRMGLNDKTAEEIAETFVEGGKKAADAYNKGVSKGTKETQVQAKNTGKRISKELVTGAVASMEKLRQKSREFWGWLNDKDAVKDIKASLDYGKGAFQQFVIQYLSSTKSVGLGSKAVKAASEAITEYGKKLYKESDYYKEDTKNIKKHKKELTDLQDERKDLQKQLKEAQKSNTKASKARAKTLKKELKENKKSIDSAKKQIKKDEKEIAKHTKEVFQNLRSTLSDSVSAFLDPLKVSLESGVDLFSKFESNSDLYEADKKKLEEQKKFLEELEKTKKEIQDEICKYDDDNTLAARKQVKRLKEQLSEVESSIEEAKQNIEQTENDMESHSQVTVNSILENMQSQISGVKKWQKNLQKLAGRGLSQGLLDKLKEMGPDGVDYVDQFMKMTSEELKKANDLFAQSENLTSQTLINNFKDSIKRTKNWADGLQKMAEMGFGQDLLEKLGAMGVEGGNYVNAFLSMTTEQVAQFNKEYAESLKLPDTVADQVISAYAYTGNQSVNAFTSALSELSKKGSEENKKIVDTAKEVSKVMGEILQPESKKTGKNVCEELAKGIIAKKKSTTTSSEKVGNAALKALKGTLSSGNGRVVAGNMVQGLKKGLTDGKSGVVAAAQKVAQEAFEAAKVTLGIKSPSRKFAEIGKYADAGFAQGLISEEKNVCKTAADVMNKALKQVSELANSDIDVQPTIRPVLDLSNIQNGAAGIHKMMDGYAVSGSVNLAGVIAKGMDSRGSLTDNSAMNAIKNLQDTLTGLLNKPNIEQHNTFSISGGNPKEIANEVSHILQQQVERRSTVWG